MKKLAPFKKEKVIREKVLDFLKKNPKGKTTTEIGKELKISRKTLEKHLQLLVFENEIYMKQYGPTRVYYPNHRLHYLDFEKLNFGNKTIWFDVMENEYGKYLLIQEKRKDKEDWVTKGSIMIPVKESKEFAKKVYKIIHSRKFERL